MKKTHRFLILSGTLTLALTLFYTHTLNSTPTNNWTYEIYGDHVLHDSNGNYLVFDNEEAYNFHAASQNNDPTWHTAINQTTTLIDKTTHEHQWLGMDGNTPFWSKADSYELTDTHEVLTADASRYSRLCVLADIETSTYQVQAVDTQTGNTLKTYEYTIPKVLRIYNEVTYQSSSQADDHS